MALDNSFRWKYVSAARIGDAQESAHKGLASEEEKALLVSYQKGIAAEKNIAAHGRNKALLALIAKGKEAEAELLVSHFPLCRSIAWQLYAKNKQFVELEDLIASGNEGLVIALRRFDHRRKCRFSTYAAWWIKNRISLFIRGERWIIKIPDKVYKQLLSMMRFVGEFRERNRREPTILEVASEFDMPFEKSRQYLVWAAQQEVSLETPVREEGSVTLGDVISECDSPWYVKPLDNHELTETMARLLKTLPPSAEQVLKLRFGLDNGEEQTLEGIGSRFGMSHDRLRQIEAKALRNLRHPTRSKRLRIFLKGAAKKAYERPFNDYDF